MSNGLLLIVAKTAFGVIISAFYPKGKIVLEILKKRKRKGKNNIIPVRISNQ